MIEASKTEQLAFSADTVWSLLADWGNTAWIPGVEDTEVFDSDLGKVRRLTMPGVGSMDEVLVQKDDAARSFAYHIPRCAMVPFDNYHGTVAVKVVDDSHCEISWCCRLEAPGMPEADVSAAANGNIARLFSYITAYLQAQQ